LEANLARAAVQDALGMEEAVGTTLEGLSELVQKLPDAGEKFSKAVAVLTALKASRIQRAALKGRLVDLDAVEDVALIKDFETLLTTDGSLTGRASNFRWILRQLFPEAASVRLVKVRALWHTFLVSELGSAFWEGFSPKYRERYLGRLESTQENKKEKKAEGPEDAAEGE
jgi:hypothetical protein